MATSHHSGVSLEAWLTLASELSEIIPDARVVSQGVDGMASARVPSSEGNSVLRGVQGDLPQMSPAGQ